MKMFKLIKKKGMNHEVGVLGIFLISFPLMLSSLSGCLMLICDRLFLAHYSLHSFNSIVTISSIIFTLQIGVNICAATADVFVGQLHGAGKKLEVGSPTWQMIWFSLFTMVFFLPIAFLLFTINPLNIEISQDEIFYFKLLTAISFLSPLSVALSSFFIGRKKTVIPLTSTILGNCINLVLNYLLIFGSPMLSIPEMGVKGAAIATTIAQIASSGMLFLIFYSKENQLKYNTNKLRMDFFLLLKILKIGYPNAIAQAMIAGGWSCFFILMNRLGEASITLASFMQTLTGFFVFLIQGLSRGIASISANLIGEKKTFLISRVLFSGIKLSIFFSIVILLVFIFYPKEILKVFFSTNDFEKAFEYFQILRPALFWGWLAFLFKSIRALLSGLLTSSGKTQFVMWNEVISIWCFFIIPIWISIKFFPFNVSWAYFIAFLYNSLAVLIYYMKFYRIDWQRDAKLI